MLNSHHNHQLGDYGKVDKGTGEFIRRGNILRDAETKDIACELNVMTGAENEKNIMASYGAKAVEMAAGPTVCEM